VALVLSGLGFGVGGPPLSASVANEFRLEDLGTSSASQQLMAQVGNVAGIQVMETVQAAADRGRTGTAALLASFHDAFLVGAAVALVGVASAAMLRSTDRRRLAVEPSPVVGESATALTPSPGALGAASAPALAVSDPSSGGLRP
jgi:hypothetical protein